MTRYKHTSKLAFGALILGLFAFVPNSANSQPIMPLDVTKSGYRMLMNVASGKADDVREDVEAKRAAGIEVDYNIQKLDKEARQDARDQARDLTKEAKGAEDDLNKAQKLAGLSTTWDIGRTYDGQAQRARELEAEGRKMLAQAQRANDAAAMKKAQDIIDAASSAKNKYNGLIQAKTLRAAGNTPWANIYTTTDSKGRIVRAYVHNDLTAIKGLMEGCMPIMVKLDQTRKCIFCPLFIVLFNTAQSMSAASYDKLADGFANLLLIGLALYLAFVSLKQVSAFTKQDGPKFVSEILTQAFKVLLAYLILTNVQQLYEYILSPMLSAGIEFGAAFLFRAKSSFDLDTCVGASVAPDGSLTGNLEGITIAAGYYDMSLFAKIDCFMRAVQQEIAVPQSIGSSLMCAARNGAKHWYGMWDLTMMITGLIIWVFSWLLCLAFAFYLIDAVVKLGIVGALMPFLIAAWPFKITSGYTSKGWAMFMNTFFTFVFLGMVVSINIELSGQAATGGEGGFDVIEDLMNGDNVKEILKIMSIGLTGLIFLLLCCIFGFKLCSEAITLATTMSEAKGGDNIGAKLGSTAGGAAKWAATKTAKGAWTVGKDTAQIVAPKVGEAIGKTKLGQNIQAKAQKFKDKFSFAQNAGVAGGDFITNNKKNNNGEDGNTHSTQPKTTPTPVTPTPTSETATPTTPKPTETTETKPTPVNSERGGRENEGGTKESTTNNYDAENTSKQTTSAEQENIDKNREASEAPPRDQDPNNTEANPIDTERVKQEAEQIASQNAERTTAQHVEEAVDKATQEKDKEAEKERERSKPAEAQQSRRQEEKVKDAEFAKRAAEAKARSLQQEVNKLRAEVTDLTDKLAKAKAETPAPGQAAGIDADQIKKWEEEKKALEARISELTSQNNT